MSYFESMYLAKDDITTDSGGRVRVSQLNTSLDGKITGIDRPNIFDDAFTGSGVYQNNMLEMYVGSGQYYVRQSRAFQPYLSGKSQIVETTFDNFQLQEGIIKRVGYFSSQSTGTYDTNKDGFWLESNGASGTFYLISSNNGTETHRSDWRDWDNYSLVSGTNWQNFNVAVFDFLWLGGAEMRLFIKTSDDFILSHRNGYVGSRQGTFTNFPNQPIRYEIRSTTGSGMFRSICSQCASEGSREDSGEGRWVDSGTTAITMASAGTKYVLKAIRKRSDYKNTPVKLSFAAVDVASVDRIRWTLEINPNLSSALTWTNVPFTTIQEATGNGSITVSGTSSVLAGGFLAQGGTIDPGVFEDTFLSWLGGKVNGTQDQIVLCVTPITSNVSVAGGIGFIQY